MYYFVKKRQIPMILTCCFGSWIIIEFILFKIDIKKLEQANDEIISNYKKKNNNCLEKNAYALEDEFDNNNDIEAKSHLVFSLKKSLNLSHPNLKSIIKNLNIYTVNKIEIKNKNKDKDFKKSTNNIIWFPYTMRTLISINNLFQLCKWKIKFKVNTINYGSDIMYEITNKNIKYDKTIIIFTGLGGMLNPFKNLINLLMKHNYKILIPIYGPSQGSLNFNFKKNQYDFYENLYDYLNKSNYLDIEICGWSLGGMLYCGFNKYIKSVKNNKIKIKKVFLVEPLIGIRGSLDTYFCKKRSYIQTVQLIDNVTRNKYFIHNRVLGYFFHTIVGQATGNSFIHFNQVEFKNYSPQNYNRYLFVSSDDIILNNKLDKGLIDNNFDYEKVYYRTGYHGGWIYSKRLVELINEIILDEKENYIEK